MEEYQRTGSEFVAMGMTQYFAVRGDKDKAFEWLDRTTGVLAANIVYSPYLASLLGDARWQTYVDALKIIAFRHLFSLSQKNASNVAPYSWQILNVFQYSMTGDLLAIICIECMRRGAK